MAMPRHHGDDFPHLHRTLHASGSPTDRQKSNGRVVAEIPAVHKLLQTRQAP